MDSLTKNAQNIEIIKEMVKKAFDGLEISTKENSIHELTEGCYNVAYLITLENDLEVILKIAPAHNTKALCYEHNIMSTEVKILNLVKEKTSIPVPKVYFYDHSKLLCSNDYFFMEKINGNTLLSLQETLSSTEKDKLNFKLGKLHKDLSTLTNDYYGYPGEKSLQSSSWPDAFMKIITAVINDGRKNNINIGIKYEKILSIVKNNIFCLDDITNPHLVHWDLWDGNIFIDLNNDNISGIIDFKRALWGDPLMEYYFNGLPEHLVSENFLKGYGITTFTSNEIKKRILYNIYLYLVMAIEYNYKKYTDDTQFEFAKVNLKQQINLLGEIYE